MVREDPETVGDPVTVFLIAFYHPHATSVISIGSYPGLSNKLFAKRRECVCAFTVRALFVLLIAARRSRGTRAFRRFARTMARFEIPDHYSTLRAGEICERKKKLITTTFHK